MSATAPESARGRLAAIPHLEVARRVAKDWGNPPHDTTLATTACGREVPTTLVTTAAERTRCSACRIGASPDDPGRMQSLVRDVEGDLWRRGRTMWSCIEQVDGQRITRAGRLPWHALISTYGPVVIERVGP